MLPRILTAAVALTAALVITPRLVTPPAVTPPAASQAALMAGDERPTAPAQAGQISAASQPGSLPVPPPAPLAAGAPLDPLTALPDPVRQDLAEFAASQGLASPPGLRAWANDLNGNGRDDLLVEADFGRDTAGRPLIYHFPYFAEDTGFRRGSSLSLAEPITEMGRDGRALIIGLGERRLRLAF